jgi:hypothetical protein
MRQIRQKAIRGTGLVLVLAALLVIVKPGHVKLADLIDSVPIVKPGHLSQS